MREMVKKRTAAEWKRWFESAAFERDFTYGGCDLGAVYSPEKTVFKVWAPTAERVAVKLYATGSEEEPGAALLRQLPMKKAAKGVWETAVSGDLAGVYYTWLVTADERTQECGDIYAKAAGVDGRRSMVVNLEETDPEGWETEQAALPPAKNPVIWEVHVKDFSFAPCSGVPAKYRGRFKAFTCTDTGLDGEKNKPTCVSYLQKLGVTHVHILPMYDYGSVEEAGDEMQFNWGYDPVNYNVPEGSYSTDPFHGEVRIRECKEMIMALHAAGIRVVMDVVYNHTYHEDSWFSRTVPYYYYRQDADGALTDGSACGNDTASDRLMYRKYMVESVCYWAKEYHLDGFRFDLMGLHDVETMNEIRRALNALPGGTQIMMYGEPWAAGPTGIRKGSVQALKANVALLDEQIGFFNDDTRDAIKGSVFFAEVPGFVNGKKGLEDKIRSSVLAWCDGAGGYQPHGPKQVLSYVSAHDNYTLWDKLLLTHSAAPSYEEKDEEVLAENRLAAGIYFTCLGIPFLQAGEEGARTKKGVGDSYNSSPLLNQLDWKRIYEYNGLKDFYTGLIALRQHFGLYGSGDRAVTQAFSFVEAAPEDTVAFHVDGQAAAKPGDWFTELFVIYNASKQQKRFALPAGNWQLLTEGTCFAWEESGRLAALAQREGAVTAAAKSVTILGKKA